MSRQCWDSVGHISNAAGLSGNPWFKNGAPSAGNDNGTVPALLPHMRTATTHTHTTHKHTHRSAPASHYDGNAPTWLQNPPVTSPVRHPVHVQVTPEFW